MIDKRSAQFALGAIALLEGAQTQSYNVTAENLTPTSSENLTTNNLVDWLLHGSTCRLDVCDQARDKKTCLTPASPWLIGTDLGAQEVDSRQLARAAANHPALLPIPEFVLNDAVRAYQPTERDVRYLYDSGDYELIVFKGTELDEKERRMRSEFTTWITESGYTIPQTVMTDDNELMRFYNFDNKKFEGGWDQIGDHLDYLHYNQIRVLDDAETHIEMSKHGYLYGYQRDRSMRPVLVFNMRKLLDTETTMDEFLDNYEFMAAYTQYHALVPGVAESWLLIVDGKDIALSEFPLSIMYQICMRFKNGYKQRMFTLIGINTNWVVKTAVSIVFKFVPQNIAQKIFIYTRGWEDHLHRLVDKDSLEEKYGGTLPNKEDDFFPPHFN